MTLDEISKLRLNNQQITQKQFKQPGEVVKWMGAIQAQDLNMAKWAIGVRLSGALENDIDKAIDQGRIIRTHILRPTWHFVAAEHLHPLLLLSAPRIKAATQSRNRQLGIDERLIKKTKRIIEKQILNNGHALRQELVTEFGKAKINLGDNMAAHLLMEAEIDGFICSGKLKNGNHTYALTDERIPKTSIHNKEEALALVSKLYFRSHGPATVNDFAWWSGLTIKESRLGIDLIKKDMHSFKINTDEYWYYEHNTITTVSHDRIDLLPAYDELIVAYKNRASLIPNKNIERIILRNGIFKPVIIKNGKTIGVWKRNTIKGILHIEYQLFNNTNNRKIEIHRNFEKYGAFTGKGIEKIELYQ